MIQLALYYNHREGKERKGKENDEDGTDYRKVRNYQC